MSAARWLGKKRNRADRRRCFRDVIADRRELLGQVVGRGVAAPRLLRQAPVDDPAHRRGNVGRDRGNRLGLLADDRCERLGRRPALEGTAARRHLVENRAERELIRPVID